MARLSAIVVFGLALGLGAPVSGLILASGTGLHNTDAPADDPGWGHLGFRASNTAIYLGDGWVLSATHVGKGEVWFHEVNTTYLDAARPPVILDNTPSGPQSEVKLWRLMADPGLPTLPIPVVTPSVGTEVVMIARGRERGAAVVWNPPGPGSWSGWEWGFGGPMRWGTNRISGTGIDVTFGVRETRSLGLLFSLDGDTADEAVVAAGDSGGAVFVDDAGTWKLAGVLYAFDPTHPGQPGNWALDQNLSYAADLAHFAADIAAVTAERACSDGTDDDGDGLIDYPDDPGCQSASDAFETDANLACDDGFDNDGDGLRDMADPGCLNAYWPKENPACDDDADNDGDGDVDWDGGSGGGSPDSFCVGHAYRDTEKKKSCGLGFEIALVLPLLASLRRRARRA